MRLGTRHPFFIALLVAATAAFALLLLAFWQPIFWAATLGILFQPVQRALQSQLAGRRSLAAFLGVLLIFFTVLVPALFLAGALVNEAAGVFTRIQSGELDPGAVLRWLQGLLPQANEIAARFGVDLNELPSKLSAAAVRGSQFIASLALSTGQNVAVFFVKFFLMLYLLFFVLRDGKSILEASVHAMPLPDHLEESLFQKFAEVSRATVKGTLIVGGVQGFLGGLIFALLGLQGAVFWGVVMVILSVLPAVGAAVVWVPTAVYLAVVGLFGKALVLFLFGAIVIGLADNLLRPVLVGRDTRMPDYLIMLSTLGGLGLFGITGFVAGPVLAALFLTLWQMFATESAEIAGGETADEAQS
jgi:predicted PurR-regulated permease PerM